MLDIFAGDFLFSTFYLIELITSLLVYWTFTVSFDC
jgi:hypothetical protein